LYRANALARPIEIALREHRIQYKVFGGQSFFERKEIKDFMAYLRLVANPNDRMAFWRVINTPHRGMGIKSCEVIDEIAQNKSISPFMALKSALDVLPKKAVAAAQDFIEFIESAGKLEVQSPASFGDLCRYLIQGTKIDKYYKDKATTISVGLKKAEMIRDLPNWLEKSAESVQQEKGQLNFHELMDALTLQQEDRSKDESGADYVSLMSIHSAKGLEFPHVFLCGVEDDLLPHRNSVEEAQGISEERRLFYVAITRAKDQLFMTHTLSRSGITRQSESKKPSRFLDEIPQDIISCDGHFEKEVAERQINKREQTKSRLSSLKDELRLNK
jgi:superfamily I DNA/RNA helicase